MRSLFLPVLLFLHHAFWDPSPEEEKYSELIIARSAFGGTHVKQLSQQEAFRSLASPTTGILDPYSSTHRPQCLDS